MSMFLDKGQGWKWYDGMVAFVAMSPMVDLGGDETWWQCHLPSRRRFAYLMDSRYNWHFKAQNGEKGMTKGDARRRAEDMYEFPQGTTVRDAETGKVITRPS